MGAEPDFRRATHPAGDAIASDMAKTIQHERFTAPAICLALAAAALLLAIAPARIRAQEPGQPPETPAPDTSQSAPDASAPAEDQTPDEQPAADPDQQAAAPTQNASAATAVPQPDMPKWPINEKPGQAAVTWDSHGLDIQATNSSLQQILKDISAATGASVEGLNKDERVFGEYGPGQARDVLSELLLGAGYNVIMIGDRGQGAPRQILLSSRHAAKDPGGAQGGQNNNNDDDSADNDVPEEQPAPPPPPRPGFPGGPPRTPQQMMQERQERLQQMRQQQPQLQPNAPQN